MIVHWTSTGLRHLSAIHSYIAQTSTRYAQNMVDRITRRSEQLAVHPLLGAFVPEYEDVTVRELLEHPYRILYRVRVDRIDILAVIHGAKPLPPTPPQ